MRVSGEEEPVSPVDEGPAEPCTILDGLGLRLGLAKMLQHPFGLAERDVRLANLEPEVDGPLGDLARGRQAAERLERLLEARQRLSVRRARRRGRPGLDQVTGRAIPRVALRYLLVRGHRFGHLVADAEHRVERAGRLAFRAVGHDHRAAPL